MSDAAAAGHSSALEALASAHTEGVQTGLLLRRASDAQIAEALQHAYAAARLGPCGLVLLGGDLHVSMSASAGPWPRGNATPPEPCWTLADALTWWRARMDGMIAAAPGIGGGPGLVPTWDGRVTTSIDGGMRGDPAAASPGEDCMAP